MNSPWSPVTSTLIALSTTLCHNQTDPSNDVIGVHSASFDEPASSLLQWFVGDEQDRFLQRSTADGTTIATQVVCPTEMREQALAEAHDVVHPGATGTYKTLRRSWWWPNMQRDVAVWVARCGQCTPSNASARVMDPGHFRARPVSALFETLSADVLRLHDQVTVSGLYGATQVSCAGVAHVATSRMRTPVRRGWAP